MVVYHPCQGPGDPTYTAAEPQGLIVGDDDPGGQKYPAAHGPEHVDTLSWDALPKYPASQGIMLPDPEGQYTPTPPLLLGAGHGEIPTRVVPLSRPPQE